MPQPPVTADMSVASILATWPQAIPYFLARRMICVGCALAAFDTLAEALDNYGYPHEDFLQGLNAFLQQAIPFVQSAHLIQENTMTDYQFIPNIESLIGEIAHHSIVSRTFYEGETVKGILFGFAPGEELSEHTSSRPAILHFLRGQATLTLGKDTMKVSPGAWVYMPANLKHSILAESETYMLLLLL